MDALDSACVLFEPVLIALLATDPRWKDNIPFHEYFHGDIGMGLGAEHQTGWTALAAHLTMTTPARPVPRPQQQQE